MTQQAGFPCEAVAVKKYKSPHKNDLSFAKGDRIRVTGFAPKDEDDDEDDDDDEEEDVQWLVGETLDGSKTGTFPASHVEMSNVGTKASENDAEHIATKESTPSEPLASTQDEDASVGTQAQGAASSKATVHKDTIDSDGVVEPLEINGAEPAKEGETSTTVAPSASNQSPTSIVTPTELPKKPSSPPLAPKPSGLAARIAAFNKPQEAPPPLPRGKPGGWKSPPPAPGAPKPVMPGMSAAQANKTATSRPKPATQSSTSGDSPSGASVSDAVTPPSATDPQQSKSNAGFSAADAQSSIKMSLKERMAALQAGGSTGGGQRESSPESSATRVKPGRIGEDRRTAAIAHMASAESETKPETPITSTDADSTEDDEAKQERAVNIGEDEASTAEASMTTESGQNGEVASNVAEVDEQASNVGDSLDSAQKEGEEDAEAKSEDQREAERRAAIAQRMAKLGGRRMGAGPGPAMFGAPAPVAAAKPRQLSEDESRKSTSAPSIHTGDDVTEEQGPASMTTKDEVDEQPTHDEGEKAKPKSSDTLAVPRRTAPPRRKKPSSTSSSQSASEPSREQTAHAGTETKEKEAEGDPVSSPSTIAVTGAAAAAATSAGIGAAILSHDSDKFTAEPEEKEDEDEGSETASPVAQTETESEFVTTTDDADDELTRAKPIAERRQTSASTATKDTTDTSIVAHSTNDTESFEPGTPVSTSELEERARQLEAFIQTPDEDLAQTQAPDIVNLMNRQPFADSTEDGPIVDREAVASPPPPTSAPPRPPSARPPVPKTSTPAPDPDSTARIASPPPTRAPPIPQASLSAAVSNQSTDHSGEAAEASHRVAEEPTILAAPKPRMAVPQEESDEEVEEEQGEIAPTAVSSSSATEDQYEEEPQDTEDEERQRRRRLAERMARMGAQPIMGAPMPFRKRTVPDPEEEADRTTDAAAAAADDNGGDDVDEGKEHVAKDETVGADEQGFLADGEEKSLDELESTPLATVAPTRLPSTRAPISSPPPIPTKSPPPPIRSPDSVARASQSLSASDLSRAGSTARSRPPVPSVTHSRQGTIDDDGDEFVSPTRTMSPPTLPSSPPPRPPSRAPPARQGSVSEKVEATGNAGMTGIAATQPKRQGSINRASSRLSGIQASEPSPRDLDVMPSSQWWRHGRPVKLPPSLLRPDAYRSVVTDDDGPSHLITITLLFEDYSSTIISVLYQDDDASESKTQIAQKHHFAPSRPSAHELQAWAQQYGIRIAKAASTLLGGGGKAHGTAVGDGTSKGFVTSLVDMATNEECLPPVGSSFGAILLAQAATTPVDQGADDVRPGDIVALHGADFKGKRGLTSYHAMYGSSNDPAFACILDVATAESSKKRKLRCALVPTAGAGGGKSSRSTGAPEEVSLRLDDVKSGLVRIFRVAPRHGWLPT